MRTSRRAGARGECAGARTDPQRRALEACVHNMVAMCVRDCEGAHVATAWL